MLAIPYRRQACSYGLIKKGASAPFLFLYTFGMFPETSKFPCPCCGYLVFDRAPGNHEICPICCWEDDMSQLRFAEMPGSANPVSLADAQHNFASFHSSSHRKEAEVREPLAGDRRDTGWRPLDPEHDNIETPQRGIPYAESYPVDDPTVLYYWRPTYWRRLSS